MPSYRPSSASMTLSQLAEKMRHIDITMLTTRTEGDALAGRPMSNNGEVDYDGDSWYFTWDQSRMVSDIRRNPQVSLAFQGDKSFHVAVEGRAELVQDKAAFEEHWTPDLDEWFKDGVDTPGLILIKVSAQRIHYWSGEEEGEVPV